ncbi:hypothetical protein FQA47_010070 [Oryzias melastigma]|uniref:Uncharacterized protein n=1 Tax=Oryzias melastigma TaxID=30732 RepID=A0A834FHT3_ORYME|nr:hypothetical protein FQA47_010070 [Oryzias melastigma]
MSRRKTSRKLKQGWEISFATVASPLSKRHKVVPRLVLSEPVHHIQRPGAFPVRRVSVRLWAEGFDTAIQALLLPWRWMPYKASGVKEHRVGCSHMQTNTHTHARRKNAGQPDWLPVSPLTPGPAWEHGGVNLNSAVRQRGRSKRRGGCITLTRMFSTPL